MGEVNSKIQFRRGIESQLPMGLEGEPLYCTDTNVLYIGQGKDKPPIPVAGAGMSSGSGGGGGGSGKSPYISTALEENLIVSTGDNLNLEIDFYSPTSGYGTLKVFINDVDAYSGRLSQGETRTTIKGELFAKGSNRVVVYVIDRAGVMSNSLIFYVRYGGVEFTTTFDAEMAYDVDSYVRYYFIPTAVDTSVPLTFYMEVDGVLNSISCTSDARASYTFPRLTAGRHWCRAWVSDGTNQSRVLEFNLILLDNSNIVIASNTKSVTVEEGNQFTLDYKVYKRGDSTFKTKTYIDDMLVTTGTCTLETNYYRNSTLSEGTHIVKIEVTDVSNTVTDYITWTVTVTASAFIAWTPVTSGATFIGTAKNRSNSDINRDKWVGVTQDGTEVNAILNNFTFNSENGWISDALVISGDSSVEIPISPLSDNAKYGFTLDIEFMTKSIGVEDAEVLSIWDNTKNCGIKITTEELIIKSTENEKRLYFGEEENISAIFVIDRDEKTAKILLNGVVCGGFALSDYVASGVPYLEDFSTDAHIILGGANKNGYCEIRNLRTYSIALGTKESMNNYISNITNKALQKEKIEFQKGDTLPTLTVYGDFSGLGKKDKKPCDIVYQSTDVTQYGESFRLEGKYSQLQYQGTSSMQYPIKNYRLNPRNEKGKVKLDPFNNGVGETRFTLKADYASSGHWQNTGLAKWVNDCLYHYNEKDEKSMNPKKWYDIQNGGKITDTRETINGFPCRLILINDGETALQEGQYEPTPGNTKDMGVFNFNNDKSNTKTLGFDTENFPYCASFEVASNSDTSAGAFMSYKGSGGSAEELEYIKNSFELRFPDEDDVGADYGFLDMNGDSTRGLKRVIDFVDKSTDEDFVAHFEEYFNKQYTFRYFLLVMGLGMVDNLGKNMMLDTWDGKIFYPRFYDMDTICSFNNSGVITFDTDIEMEQGYWNTSSSRLWTRIRDLFHSELVEIYKDMRQNGYNYEKLMQYFYDEQIKVIPESYYNKDYDVKYAPYATEYMGIANGNAYEHLKRWLKRRMLFTDSLYDYAPSYADSLTIRANTTEPMTIEIETYAPVYQHMSWYNNQMDKKKIDGKTAVTFTGTAQASTDQEVIIYGGSNIKRIRGISTMNPNSMLIGNATKLVELECTNATLLTDINSNKANLSPNKYLTKVDLSGCSALGGTLRLNNSPLLSDVNVKGTAITGMLFPTSIKNLGTLRVPKGVTELTLNDAKTLTTLDLEEGYLLETLSLSNCNKLKSFDLSKVKNITLDNSYIAEEIRLSTNQLVNLKNMALLKRLVYTPNSEIEDFNLATLKNSPDVTITSFNCPNFKEFITTAPQRISYGESDDNIYPNKLFMANKLDLRGLQVDTVKFLCTTDIFDLKLPNTLKNFYCDSAFDLDTSVITDGDYDVIHSDLIRPYTEEYNENVYNGYNQVTEIVKINIDEPSFVYDLAYHSDYIPIKPNSSYTVSKDSETGWLSVIGFNKDKSEKINIYKAGNTGDKNAYNLTIPDNVYFIMFGAIANYSLTLTYEKPYTPNIVPTSANGSLLFNINQDTPQQNTPYIWDLQGLKLNDFHTYGVNNRVKPSDMILKGIDADKLVKVLGSCTNSGDNGSFSNTYIHTNTGYALGVFSLSEGTHILDCNLQEWNITTFTYDANTEGKQNSPGYAWNQSRKNFVLNKDANVVLNIPKDINWFSIDGVRYYLNDIPTLDLTRGDYNFKDFIVGAVDNQSVTRFIESIESVNSITMPKRLADYKVQIKNADITPNNYNTMLYPKLVDTTLPITGKLDYSKYKGKYLSWAFAYTTNDVERIPLDSRKQGQIINDYNKLYSTDFIDIVDVWAYKDDDFSNRATNNNITKAYIELTQGNYQTRIDEVLQWYPNCTDLYLFEDGSVTDLSYMLEGNNVIGQSQIVNVTFIEGYFENLTLLNTSFRNTAKLETVNNLPNSVTNMSYCFYNSFNFRYLSNFPSNVQNLGCCFRHTAIETIPNIPISANHFDGAFYECSKFNQRLDLSNNNIGTNGLRSIFQGCSSLTYTPILPSNYTSSLQSAFSGTKITTAPVLPDGVTSLQFAFQNCTELTTVGNIPSSCNNYQNAFNGCSKLTSVPETGWKGGMASTFYGCTSLNQQITIESATSLDNTFRECTSLTITPILPAKMVNGSMKNCFHSNSNLVNPPITPEGITNMDATYWNCTSLTKEPIIPDTVTIIANILYGTKITKVAIPLEKLTGYGNALYACGLLTDITWKGKRKTNLDLIEMACPSYTQEDLKELVNDNLEDLYKDKVKISFGDNKITVNGTETTITT